MARFRLVDCPEILCPSPYAHRLKTRGDVGWRTLVLAGGTAWLLAAGLVGTIYAHSRSARAGSPDRSALSQSADAAASLQSYPEPAEPAVRAAAAKPMFDTPSGPELLSGTTQEAAAAPKKTPATTP